MNLKIIFALFKTKLRPMINLDKKEYFAFLDRWFHIYPEPKVTPDKVEAELLELADKEAS